MKRRQFFMAAAASASAIDLLADVNLGFATSLEKKLSLLENQSLAGGAENEDFWSWIRESYTTSPNIINLNNGGVSPQPKIVQDAHIRYYQMCNEAPSYYMWRTLDQGREPLRLKLATLCGVDPNEIAINRNSTEGLNNIIFGLNLNEGDEVVLSSFDYPNMMNAWKQREKRDKIKLVWIDIPQPFADEKSVVKIYEDAITSRTRIVHITHTINWTGNIVPCRAIADLAHSRNCEVIVDAAHSFAHIDYKIEDTGADYLATSLHKWLCAPFGSGLLYIKKDKIKNVWALLSSKDPDGDDIRKFESLGTRSFASEMAIGTAVDFHNVIGGKRKEARLRFLKDYWLDKTRKLPGLNLATSTDARYSCAIANVGFEGWEAMQVETYLFDKYKVHTVAIVHEKVNGIRITPNVYTSLQELDVLARGLAEISAKGGTPAR